MADHRKPDLVDSATIQAPRRRPASDGALGPSTEATISSPAPPGGGAAPTAGAWPVERYDRVSLLGAGGMGEVHLAADRVIGREVALKVLRADDRTSAEGVARFVREAQVQARLEHPAVVPVYDLGTAADGAAWFTMKRVRGRTLDRILAALARGEPEAEDAFSRRKLLDAFARVCLAVDFAHAQGVLHRDLKPANIMLGDFGEVYVLDWGLAKLAGVQEDLRPDPVSPPVERTIEGSVMGTPGFMAPEQARGELEAVDERSDVYSLGAILFEIIALEPLHRGRTVDAIITSTLAGADARPSRRGHPGVAPELDAICVRATALAPADRHATPRDLGAAVERYLDGDRDLERRRQIGAEHLATARQILDGAAGASRDPEARAEALRELGRAVALDPSNGVALDHLVRLLVEPPEVTPPEAEAELRRARVEHQRAVARSGALRYSIWSAFLPIVLWMGIRDWPVAVAISVFLLLSGGICWWLARGGGIGEAETMVVVATTCVAIALISNLFGPLILVPTLAATNAMLFVANVNRRHRAGIITLSVLAIAVPFFVEAAGLVPPAYSFEGTVLRVFPRATWFPPLASTAGLLVMSCAMVVVPTMMVGRLRDEFASAERRLFLQAWHLRQLVPKEARAAIPWTSRTRRLAASEVTGTPAAPPATSPPGAPDDARTSGPGPR